MMIVRRKKKVLRKGGRMIMRQQHPEDEVEGIGYSVEKEVPFRRTRITTAISVNKR
jgi:hypothetical protein